MLGEKEIKSIIVSRFQFMLSYHLVLLGLAYYLSFHFHAGLNWIIFIITAFSLYLYSFLFHVKKRAQLIWIVYNKITHIHTTLEDSKEIVRQQKWPLRLFALFEIKIALSTRESEEKTGVIDRLLSAAMLSLEGIYKIAEDFLLPAIIIERLPLSEAAGKLRQLTHNLPATLAGVFGLDIFGGIISSIINFIYRGIVLCAFFGFWFLPHILNEQPIFSIHPSLKNTRFIYFSLFAGIIIVSSIRESLKIFITTLKAIYFSLFYISINKEYELAPDMKEKITLYLMSTSSQSL